MKVSKRIFELETESAFSILANANKLIKEGKDVINLGIGQPDFKTPENIQEAAIKAIRDGHHGYTPSNGLLELREAISEMIEDDYNTNINPDKILITPGGKPVIFFSIMILGGKENEIIYPDPGFPIYRSMIKYSGAKAVPLVLSEQDDFQIKLDKLESLITNKTSMIIINNPHNPTGAFMPKDKIQKLVTMLEKYPHTYILSDEIYSKIIFEKKTMPSLLEYECLKERLIVLEGWSKTFCMTGWRLGWSVWPSDLFEFANKLCVNDHSCPSSISQYAGLEAVKGPKDQVYKIVNEFEKRKIFLYKNINKLKNIKCFKPGGAFYAFPNISRSGLDGKKFSDIALYEKGVALVPGTSFGESGVNYVRISYANSMENLEKAIYRISTI